MSTSKRYDYYTRERLISALFQRDQVIKELRTSVDFKTYILLSDEMEKLRTELQSWQQTCLAYQQWFTEHEYLQGK